MAYSNNGTVSYVTLYIISCKTSVFYCPFMQIVQFGLEHPNASVMIVKWMNKYFESK